jgi:hypothetical protein
MATTARKRRPWIVILLSLIGGLLILATGVGIVVLRMLVISANLPPTIEGLVGQGYAPMLGTGFAHGMSYDVGVFADIIPGIVIVVAAIMMIARPSRAVSLAYVVLIFSFISLVGAGGLIIGWFLGLLGGSIGVMSRMSSPRLMMPGEPRKRDIS